MEEPSGFVIHLSVSRAGPGDAMSDTKNQIRTIHDKHLIGDKRLPSDVILSVVKQLLYKILEAEGGYLADNKCGLMVAWEKAREAEVENEPA